MRHALSLLLILSWISGCKTYQPAPLDLADYQQNKLKRSPSMNSVQDFARRLNSAQPDSPLHFEPQDGLTLGEAEIVALVLNPELRIQRLRANVALAESKYAGRWEDPSLNLNLLKIRESIPDPWYINPTLTFTIPLSGRLRVAKALAESKHQVELDRAYEAEREVIKNLRDEWSHWSSLDLKINETRSALSELDAVIETTERLAELGEMPRPESRLFLMERAQHRDQLLDLEARSEESWIQIHTLMGLLPDAEIHLEPQIKRSDTAVPDIELLIANNPTLERLRSEYEVAEKQFQLEVRKQYPDLVLGPQAETDGGQKRIGIGATLPIPVLNANRGPIAVARAERDLARAAFETEYDQLESRLTILHRQLRSAQSRLEIMENTLIPLTDRQLKEAWQLLELGEQDGLVLLESLSRSIEVRTRLIDLHLKLATTQNAMDLLTETPVH